MNSTPNQIMVIGGGIAGLSAAVDLARLGMAVDLVEKSSALGGHAAQLSCKATDRCVACGACLVADKIRQATGHDKIRIHLNTVVDRIDRTSAFDITLKQGPEPLHLTADAVLMASGFSPFDPAVKPYGYGRFDNVLTSLELNRMMRAQGAVRRPSDGAPPRNMAFIQCVGSRDSSIGHLWCSKICCGEALRMARALQGRRPELEAVFFYIDVQNFGKNFQACYAEMKQKVRMIRAIPADVVKTNDDRLKLSYFDPETKSYQEAVFDMVILSVGLAASESTRNLAEQLNIGPQPLAYAEKTPRMLPDGVFVAGAAIEPMSIAESVQSAGKAAHDIFNYLQTAFQQ